MRARRLLVIVGALAAGWSCGDSVTGLDSLPNGMVKFAGTWRVRGDSGTVVVFAAVDTVQTFVPTGGIATVYGSAIGAGTGSLSNGASWSGQCTLSYYLYRTENPDPTPYSEELYCSGPSNGRPVTIQVIRRQATPIPITTQWDGDVTMVAGSIPDRTATVTRIAR